MYDMGGKLLNGIKSMYVNSLACVRVIGDDILCSLGSLIYIWTHDELGKNGDGEEGSEISREGKRIDIDWSLVCR